MHLIPLVLIFHHTAIIAVRVSDYYPPKSIRWTAAGEGVEKLQA